jgi:hypothetical protein
MRSNALKVGTFIGLLALSTAALACHDTPASRAADQKALASLKAQARESAVVYGVLESALGYDLHDQNPDWNEVATLRIIHVYKGEYQPGQRIQMRPGWPPLMTCMPLRISAPKGAYGVLILEKPSDAQPIRHNGFLPDAFVAMLMKDGVIQSARSSPRS